MEKMTHDYIRQVIPEEISEKGGALLRLVNGKTVPLETSIKEAKAAGYVLGDEELVKRQFEGLVKCMRDGTEADGMARQIGGWVTVYPVFVGPIHVNGRPFPPADALRIDWAVEGTDKSGTTPAEKFTSDATLITIAADALAELASEEYDGKTIVFTVRGNFASARISATLKYAPPPLEATWDGTLKTNGGEITVGGTVGKQLAELYRTSPEELYERVGWYDPDGEKMNDNPVGARGDTLVIMAAFPGDYPVGEHVGETFTFKVKTKNAAGELIEFSHGFELKEA